MILNHFDHLVRDKSFDIQWYNTEGGPYSDTRNLVFFANTARKSIGCIVKHFILRHLFEFVAGAAAIILLTTQIRGWLKRRETQRVSRAFYGDVKESLKSMQGSAFGRAAGLSQADLLRKYLSMPQMKDCLKRDEKTFNS